MDKAQGSVSEILTVRTDERYPDLPDGVPYIWRVDYKRQGCEDFMYVFAKDELGAYQRAAKQLAAMDQRRAPKTWPKKSRP